MVPVSRLVSKLFQTAGEMGCQTRRYAKDFRRTSSLAHTYKKLLGNSKAVYSGQFPAAKPLRVYYCEQYNPGTPQFFSPDRLASASKPGSHEDMLKGTMQS